MSRIINKVKYLIKRWYGLTFESDVLVKKSFLTIESKNNIERKAVSNRIYERNYDEWNNRVKHKKQVICLMFHVKHFLRH